MHYFSPVNGHNTVIIMQCTECSVLRFFFSRLSAFIYIMTLTDALIRLSFLCVSLLFVRSLRTEHIHLTWTSRTKLYFSLAVCYSKAVNGQRRREEFIEISRFGPFQLATWLSARELVFFSLISFDSFARFESVFRLLPRISHIAWNEAITEEAPSRWRIKQQNESV